LRNRRLLLCLHTIFRALIYWAHRAVILAIAWHLVETLFSPEFGPPVESTYILCAASLLLLGSAMLVSLCESRSMSLSAVSSVSSKECVVSLCHSKTSKNYMFATSSSRSCSSKCGNRHFYYLFFIVTTGYS